MSSLERLQEAVLDAAERDQPVRIVGGNSKSFLGYGPGPKEKELDTGEYAGIIDYRPEELMLRVKAGTSLASVNALLAENRQMLGAEPPDFGGSTMGGVVATGISGSRRPYAGAVRDHVLGVGMILASGEYAEFGGQVMKNVAGYDVSRLATGSLGMLGIILEVSLKVLPRPGCETTITMPLSSSEAIEKLNQLRQMHTPLSAACYFQDTLWLRLSGTPRSVQSACTRIGGHICHEGETFWRDLREHTLPFFNSKLPLWRVSLAPNEPPAKLQGEVLIDWAGAQRWISTGAPADIPRAYANRRNGHATLFRNPESSSELRFHPLPDKLLALHKNIKQAFDPANLINPGVMYPTL